MGLVEKRKVRVACYIDGFNLYHAIDNLKKNHLKWVNLASLMNSFIDPNVHEITRIYYFSAFAKHRPSVHRHFEYVAALKHFGVVPVMAEFMRKDVECKGCGRVWDKYEEKQTDVNLAVGILEGAYRQHYDEAFVVTRDSDIAPALRAVKALPTVRTIKIIAPPYLKHSKELVRIAHKKASISEVHLERNLLPQQIVDGAGNVVATRPARWDPP